MPELFVVDWFTCEKKVIKLLSEVSMILYWYLTLVSDDTSSLVFFPLFPPVLAGS